MDGKQCKTCTCFGSLGHGQDESLQRLRKVPSEGFFGFAIGFIGFLSENNVKRFFGFSIGLFFLLENNVKICIFFCGI